MVFKKPHWPRENETVEMLCYIGSGVLGVFLAVCAILMLLPLGHQYDDAPYQDNRTFVHGLVNIAWFISRVVYLWLRLICLGVWHCFGVASGQVDTFFDVLVGLTLKVMALLEQCTEWISWFPRCFVSSLKHGGFTCTWAAHDAPTPVGETAMSSYSKRYIDMEGTGYMILDAYMDTHEKIYARDVERMLADGILMTHEEHASRCWLEEAAKYVKRHARVYLS